MMLVDGPSLATVIAREAPLPVARVISIVGQVASALDAAHAQGVIHRDVKPGNIMILESRGLGGTDHAYLADFGLTRSASAMTQVTRAGSFLGTLSYVAPEQLHGGVVDGRADQYALACTAFEMLTKGPPFARESEVALITAHLYEPPPPLASVRPDLPEGLSAVTGRAMAKEPADRFVSTGEFAAALNAATVSAVAGPTITDGRVRRPMAGHASPQHPVAGTGTRASLGLVGLVIILAIAVVGAGGVLALNFLNRDSIASVAQVTDAPTDLGHDVTPSTPVSKASDTPAPTAPDGSVATAPNLPAGSWAITFVADPPVADHPLKSPDSRQYTDLRLTCSSPSQCLFVSPVFDGASQVGEITYRWEGQAFVARADLYNVGQRCRAGIGEITNAYNTRQEIRVAPEPASATSVTHLVGIKTVFGDPTPAGALAGCASYSVQFSADMVYLGAAVIPTVAPTAGPELDVPFGAFQIMDLEDIATGGDSTVPRANVGFQPAVQWFIWDTGEQEDNLLSATFLLQLDGEPVPTQFTYSDLPLLVANTSLRIMRVKVIFATIPGGLPAGPHTFTGTWLGFDKSDPFGPITVQFQ
jgi:hypothetical protein